MARANSGRRNASVKIGISKAFGDAGGLGLGTNEVAIVEDDGAGLLKIEHRAEVKRDRSAACFHQPLRIGCPQCPHFIER